MKNFFLCFLIVSLISFTGCSTNSENPADSSAAPSEALPLQTEDIQTRTVYLYGSSNAQLPEYKIWESILARPEVESYNMLGTTQGKVEKEDGFYILAATMLETDGTDNFSNFGYQLVKGESITTDSTGKCFITEDFAKQIKKEVGDSIQIETDTAKKEFTIQGILARSSEQDQKMEKEVILTIKDFLAIIDQTKKDQIMLYSVTCHSEEEAKNFQKEVNKSLTQEFLEFRFMTQEDSSTSSDLDIKQIGTLDGTDLDGNALNTDLFIKNGITMINIWATYCNPCISEMPHIGELYEEYKKEGKAFTIIGICSDTIGINGEKDESSIETAKSIVEATKVNYLNIIPGEEILQNILMKVSVVPTTIFVDETGAVKKTVFGSKTKEDWKEIIDSLLEE